MHRLAIFVLFIPAVAMADDKPRLDAYGDLLPPGAIARIGTNRFRAPKWVLESALSPDEKIVICAGNNSIAAVNRETGKILFDVKREHSLPNPYVAFSVRGEEFFVVKGVNQLNAHSVATGNVERTLRLPAPAAMKVRSIAGSDKLLAWTTYEHNSSSMSAWIDPKSGEFTQITDYPGENIGITSDGKTQYGMIRYEKRAEIWTRTADGRLKWIISLDDKITATAFDEKSELIALGCDGEVLLLDLKTAKLTRHRFPGVEKLHEPWPTAMAFLPGSNGPVLWSGDNLGQIRRFSCSDGKWLPPLLADDDRIVGMHPLRDGKHIVTVSRDGAVRTWNEKGEETARRNEFRKSVVASISGDGKRVATVDGRGRALVWDVKTSRIVESLSESGEAAAACRWMPKGNRLVIARGTIDVWQFTAGQKPALSKINVNRPTLSITAMTVVPNSDSIVVGESNRHLHAFDVSTRQKLAWGNWPLEAATATISAAEDRVAIAWSRGILALSTANGELLFKNTLPYNQSVPALAVPPAGDVIAVNINETDLWLVNADWTTVIHSIRANARHLCFSRNGAWLAYADKNDVVVLERHTFGEVARFKGHVDVVTGLEFSDDGRTLLSTSDDLCCLVWSLQPLDQPKKPVTPEVLWTQLAGDATSAQRAIWQFADLGQTGVEFLRQQLQNRRPPLSQKQIEACLACLDKSDPRFRLFGRAILSTVNHESKSALAVGFAFVRSTEAKEFLELLLDRLELNYPVSPDELRLHRAVQALEWIGTREAKAVLEEAAKMHPNALFVNECKAAVRRMASLTNER